MRSSIYSKLFIIASVLLHATRVSAVTNSSNHYLSVANSSSDQARSKELCTFLHQAIEKATKESATTECNIIGAQKLDVVKNSGRYKYHFTYEEKKDGSVRLEIENWSKSRDQTDFSVAPWRIEPDISENQRFHAQKIISGFFSGYDNKLRLHKEFYLAKGHSTSQRITLDADGEYFDRAKQKTISFNDAYSLYQDENPKQKHYLRAALEMIAILGVGTVWYWSNQDFNSVDWELRWDWKSWRKKITFEAVAFDTNGFDTNAYSHPRAGAAYYMYSRANNLNALESLLYATAASTLWEYLIEFKEKISLNDLIVTPVAGVVIGEVMVQLGAFFDRGSFNIVNQVLATIFGHPRKLHNWIDKNKPRRTGNVDRIGFTKDIWHEFDFFGAMANIEGSGTDIGSFNRTDFELGLETNIVNIPTYDKPGHVTQILTDGNFTKTITKVSINSDGLSDFVFFAKAALAGYYKQAIDKDRTGNLDGYSFFVGIASAFEYAAHTRNKKGGNEAENEHYPMDLIGIVNVLGPTLELNYYYKGLHIKANIDVFPTFAMVRSYAFEQYTNVHSTEGIKRVLSEQKYYYAFGVTAAPELELSFKDFSFEGAIKFDYFDSIEGHDRYQQEVTNDIDLKDYRLNYRAAISYLLRRYNLPFKVALGYERYVRYGEVGDASSKRKEDMITGKLVVNF